VKKGLLSLCLAMLIASIVNSQTFSPSPSVVGTAQSIADFATRKRPVADRSKLPPALRNVRLDHLSSGALMLLDHGGDLVVPPPQWSSRAAAESFAETQTALTVPLDTSVGLNIRLGDDPAALPPNMRAQAEPHIARSVVNPNVLLGTFQEGRFTTAGAVDCGYSVSLNGGLTWTRALIQGLTMTSGGPYFRATDPVAAFDDDGAMYLNTLAATDTNFDNGVVVVSRSTNSGVSFASPAVAYRPPSNAVFPDKDWIAINTFPGTPTTGRLLVTFTLFSSSSIEGAPIFRTYSDNLGATWSAAAPVNPAGSNSQGSQPVFLPGGKLAVVYWNFGSVSDPSERLEVVISNDGGVTFGSPIKITNVVEYSDPQIRNGVFLPSAATDRTTGDLYVVYQATFAGAPRIMFTKSTNGGVTWSAPVPISDNPPASGVFNAAISASPDGQTLTASFYDHRNNPGSTTLVDLYLAQSFDGGATWQPNIRLTSVSSDATLAPLTAEGYMLGDYLGIAETTDTNVPAVPIWVDTRTGNPDPFITRVTIPTVHLARMLNLSTRLDVGIADNVLIGGFIVTSGTSKDAILRAIGPSLSNFGITNPLQDPTLELHDQAGTLIAFNDNWKDTQEAEILATGIPPNDDRESAIVVQSLAPGDYTAIVRGSNTTTGVALVEAYDLAAAAPSKFGNISTRGLVGTVQNVMIGGFIVGDDNGVSGSGSIKVLLRGIGPSLAQSGVAGSLQDPVLELHNGDGAMIATNDNWRDTQETEIQATGLAPTDDRESAIVASLPKGNYTAVLSGKNSTTGVALVEVYNLP
jgi:hypothetical protein